MKNTEKQWILFKQWGKHASNYMRKTGKPYFVVDFPYRSPVFVAK